MAETVYLNDGTTECIFDEKDIFLERLLKERLGDDVARCFRNYLDELKEEHQAEVDELKETLQDTTNALDEERHKCYTERTEESEDD